MWGDRYFSRYWGDRYWSNGGSGTPVPPVVVPDVRPAPGGLHRKRRRDEKDTRRRRILLEDGRILIPADDEAYRRAVEEIVAGFRGDETLPAAPTRRRRRVKGAVVSPPPTARMRSVNTLPGEFYNALEQHRAGVLNYLSIMAAWQTYLDEQDEDEAVTLLLMN